MGNQVVTYCNAMTDFLENERTIEKDFIVVNTSTEEVG
jgi:hypothetical protein